MSTPPPVEGDEGDADTPVQASAWLGRNKAQIKVGVACLGRVVSVRSADLTSRARVLITHARGRHCGRSMRPRWST